MAPAFTNRPLAWSFRDAKVGSIVIGLSLCGWAQAEDFSLHGQATWIAQQKAPFAATYSGERSLSPHREKSYSWTSTLFVGVGVGPSTEVFVNPELVQGAALLGLMGLGGLTNAELQKTAGSTPQAYWARAFVRHMVNVDAEPADEEEIPSAINQLARRQSRQRWVMTWGRLAVTDVFDTNRWAHDGRTQLLNWSFLTHGAFDFAADARGYSTGLVIERYMGPWTWRWGRFLVPQESNGSTLNPHWSRQFGDQVEWQVDHTAWGAKGGSIRGLIFHNKAAMAAYGDAWSTPSSGAPLPKPLSSVRRVQSKWGWGLSLDQQIHDQVGTFMRIGQHDGKTEAYSFTSIDQSSSFGLTTVGTAWLQPAEEWSLAWAVNGLSSSHRRYLAAGGTDFFLGDGALRYGREAIVEILYGIPLTAAIKASVDFQHITNPGYNRDRGPVRLLALRLHAEF